MDGKRLFITVKVGDTAGSVKKGKLLTVLGVSLMLMVPYE